MVEKVQTVSGIFSRSLSASRKHADEAADGDSAGRQGGTACQGGAALDMRELSRG